MRVLGLFLFSLSFSSNVLAQVNRDPDYVFEYSKLRQLLKRTKILPKEHNDLQQRPLNSKEFMVSTHDEQDVLKVKFWVDEITAKVAVGIDEQMESPRKLKKLIVSTMKKWDYEHYVESKLKRFLPKKSGLKVPADLKDEYNKFSAALSNLTLKNLVISQYLVKLRGHHKVLVLNAQWYKQASSYSSCFTSDLEDFWEVLRHFVGQDFRVQFESLIFDVVKEEEQRIATDFLAWVTSNMWINLGSAYFYANNLSNELEASTQIQIISQTLSTILVDKLPEKELLEMVTDFNGRQISDDETVPMQVGS